MDGVRANPIESMDNKNIRREFPVDEMPERFDKFRPFVAGINVKDAL